MHTPIRFGGGGGSGSNDCTAIADDVLESKTAIYDGSDDEPVAGSMVDKSGTTQSATASLDATNSRVQLTIPITAKYSTASKLYATYSTIRDLIGLTAAKIATGYTILGVSGAYKGLGDATVTQVLSGKKFSTASLSNATGTMTNKAATTTAATPSLDTTNSRVKMTIPTTAYYDTSAVLYATYSTMRSLIGLTAAKIKKGESILGITGTWEGYVASGGELYDHGTVGSLGGSISTYMQNSTYFKVTLDTSCIVVKTGANDSTTRSAGISFGTAINLAGYSKITIKFTMVTVPTSSENYLYICVDSTQPTDYQTYHYNNADLYSDRTYLSSCSTSTNTVSLDVSSVSSTKYIWVYFHAYTPYELNLTEVTLS